MPSPNNPPKKPKKESPEDKTIALNRRGRYAYDIEESLEAGIALTGTEVKSARAGNVQIAEAYARVEGTKARPEVYVHGLTIAPYTQGNVFNVDSKRKRRLLLHREQIQKMQVRVEQKGYTLVPLKFYFTRGLAKLEIGVGKGRKTHDKRAVIAERETKRDLQRQMGKDR